VYLKKYELILRAIGSADGIPPNPLPFCPPERSVFCSAFGGAIIPVFSVQKMFELRSVIATSSDVSPKELL